MYGTNARCISRECTRRTASAKPKIAPAAKPTIASFAVKSAAFSSTEMSSGPPSRVGCHRARKIVCTCGNDVSLTRNGHVQPVLTHTQR